ncbi:MAG: hypothetical protein CSA55_02670 [Ilumatobacter coccineus]|uniref:Major facilitator superfamily transporter n=1 Tax=Ilumatobacter coccineus TaxID=467094 RepID=A0A2G6KB80_9ACTN|nr:MAG: hypothetical protein CSA55_02670 [Ilumatobacter coccineus]
MVPVIAVDYTISTGKVGIISTAQLVGFVIASWLIPRHVTPRRRTMVIALLLGVAANLAAVVAPTFVLVTATRFVNGLSLGLIAWLSWAEVFGDDDRVSDIAMIGPLVGTLAAPLAAAVLDLSNLDGLFIVLAVLYLTPLPFVAKMNLSIETPPRDARHRPARSALVILIALGAYTFGSSAVSVFSAAIASDLIKMSPTTIALAFSVGSLAGIPAARFKGHRRGSGLWLVVTAVSVFAVSAVYHQVIFIVAFAAWGFSFWMTLPAAFSLLATNSRYPAERAGDAQAIMAAGRVIGPLAGGLAYEFSPRMLGAVAAAAMVMAAIMLLAIEKPGKRVEVTSPG